MKVKLRVGAAIAGAAWMATGAAAGADTLTAGGKLARPVDVREYVFLSTGYGMAYGPAKDLAEGQPPFTNVYVKPEAYRSFMKTGVWPDGSVFLLEVRRGVANASIDSTGRSQGELLALEAAVKDRTHFPDGGWAYFDFGNAKAPLSSAAPLPRTASCYSCHSAHGAVEWSFTQFYPEQFAVAKEKGTVRKDYDPDVKAK